MGWVSNPGGSAGGGGTPDDNTVTSAKIVDGAIVNADVNASAALAYSKFATLNTGQVLAGNAGTPTATTLGGDVAVGATGTATIADLAVTARKQADLARLGGWAPTSAIAQNMSRIIGATDNSGGVSGTLQLGGGFLLPGGRAISNISLVSGGTSAVTSTHCWFCLVDRNLNVLATTLDDTAASPWTNSSVKTLQIATTLGGGTPGTYTPANDIEAYVGVCQVATTRASILGGLLGSAQISAPILGATSTASLTTPGSLGSTAGALTSVVRVPYAYVT